jgi:hypothetical protein
MILPSRQSGQSKYCGNCYHHCVSDYPRKIFCLLRFKRRLEPVVPTLELCESWEPDSEQCHCVEEALKKNTSA